MVSTLPAEIVEEILLRVSPDEPAHLVRAAVVCRAWHSILSDHDFLRRYRRFHRTPPLLGYICSFTTDTVQFVPTTSIAASPVRMTALNCIGRIATMDCHHGRVLIKAMPGSGLVDRLIVWDPITDAQNHLILPTYLHNQTSQYNHVGAVMCAKDGCDHLDCHGGAFRVVLLGMSHDYNGVHTWASVYSSETSAWSARTVNGIRIQYLCDYRLSLLTGDALYFSTISTPGYSIIKYDLRKHELSVMHTPGEGCPILVKGSGGGLGVAAILHNCIYMWSWKVGINGIGEWVKCKIVELDDTLLPKGGQPALLICMAEGTNTMFIAKEHTRVFMLNLKSKKVRKLGERNKHIYGLIVPYMSFENPKY